MYLQRFLITAVSEECFGLLREGNIAQDILFAFSQVAKILLRTRDFRRDGIVITAFKRLLIAEGKLHQFRADGCR